MLAFLLTKAGPHQRRPIKKSFVYKRMVNNYKQRSKKWQMTFSVSFAAPLDNKYEISKEGKIFGEAI